MKRQGLEKKIISMAGRSFFGSFLLFSLFMLFLPTYVLAAPPQVVCVPQVPSDLLVPHETWSGEPTILKGVARDEDGDLVGGTYYWEFGDGEESLPQSITNPDNLAATHTYVADPDTLLIARLHVTDVAGEASSDEYRILIKEKTLDVEVNKAIDDGLWWLCISRQTLSDSTFRWCNGCGYNYCANTTASAVQAFEINGHLETGDPDEDPYVETVRGGIDYLLTRLRTYNISLQAGGDPDSNGNGIGLAVNSGRSIYETGAVMDALVASGTPDAIARTGGANVIGRRYQDIVQEMVDMYAWGMDDSGGDRGGWRYSWNSDSDNSAAQWGAIGMVAAERHFGCLVPDWVKTWNNYWLNASYNGTGFGYAGKGCGWATTPSGMVQLAFDGKDVNDPRWQTAEAWLGNNWSSFLNAWSGFYSYGYYAFTKAMRLALPQEVSHFSSTGLDWYGDETNGLARHLVDHQYSSGYWPNRSWLGARTATAWNVIILTRTLFEKPPVAIIHAEPNPGAVGQTIEFDASASYHVDPAKEIDEYLWDFDASDGVDFEHPDSTGTQTSHAYGDLRDYVVSLKVIDNSTPERFDISTLTMHITIPPHPPTAVVGGPYIGAVGEDVHVDGSGSYDIDKGEGDSIIAWDWESDFVAPYDFDEAHGETATLPAFVTSNRYDIALRVTDNTEVVFPSSGESNLTDVAYGEVTVYKVGVTDLAARPKATKCQLTWTHIGVDSYDALRSEKGPNEGFELIGTTSSTYSTYLDYNVELRKDYWYRIRCELDGETVLSAPVHVNSRGRIRNQPPVISSDPVTDAQEGVLYQYDVEATDPEGTALTYLLDQASDGMSIDAATGLITWTPSFDQVGVNDVMVRVQDARRASATQFFQIIVSPRPNEAPVADPGGPYSGLTDEVITFDGSGSSDPDGDPIVEYHWVFGDGNDAYGVQVSHAYTAAGTYTVTLYATDNRGATGSAETTCQIEIPNRAPIAAAGGPYEGEVNTQITFDGSQSYDPDGDPLTYTWNFGDSTPAETGVIVSHVYAAEGIYDVTVTVDDGRGGTDTNETTVTVSPPNQPPEASFTVEGDLVKWATLTLDATGSSDPEGRPLASWEWDFGDGSSTTGAIVTHGYAEPGDYTVVLTVTDDKGAPGTAQQTLTIVHPPNHDPIIDAGGPYQGPINTAITLTATGADPDGDELTYTWGYGGQTYSGQSVELTFDATGTYEVQLSAEDGYGGTAWDVASVMAYDPDAPVDQVPPEVALTSPSSGDTLSGVVDIEGSVTDENLANWVLEYVPAGSDDWVEISSGTNSVTDGLLGQIDVGLMPDDFYRFRLTANDYNQSSSTWIECKVNDPVKLGRFSITYEDLSLPAMGMTLNIRRTYDSTRKTKGDFGIGWTLDIKTAEIREDASHNVFITLPDGRRVAFAFTPVRMSPWFPFYEARFTAPPGVFDELDFVGNRMVVFTGGDWYFFLDSRGKFNPDIYILKTKKGLTCTIDQDFGVTRVEDRNSNYLEINENGIISSCSRNVVFTRDGDGRIVSIVDPVGKQLIYTYDANGDLVTHSDQENNETRYVYDSDHYLLVIEAPDGNRPVKSEYYADGRLAAHEDSSGNRSTYAYDIDNRKETVTDPRGYSTTYTYDEMGRAVEVEDPLMGKTIYEYDANGNMISKTDPSGRTIEYTYDGCGNKLTENSYPDATTALTSTYTYNYLNQMTSATRPLGDRVLFFYNDDGDLLRKEKENQAGQMLYVEKWTFDNFGNRLTYEDGNGKITAYGYNQYGDRTRKTDPSGVVTDYEYDAMGRLTARIDGLGNCTEFTYDGLGNMSSVRRHEGETLYEIDYNYQHKVSSLLDGNGQTGFEYNGQGRLVKVTDAAGGIVQSSYDSMGNLASVTDGNNHTTGYGYDEAGRLVSRTDPVSNDWICGYDGDGYLTKKELSTGSSITYEHDGTGRLVSTSRPEGTVTYNYDDNSQVTNIVESIGGQDFSTAFGYNAIGWLTSVTDPNNRTVAYEYDAGGNRTKVTAPDATAIKYDYDAASRLANVSVGNSQVTFAYDGAGRRASATCSNGVITEYGYDSLGRLSSVVIKGAGNNVIASYDYIIDLLGNRTAVNMHDGQITWGLDSLNRLASESINSTILGTSSQSFTYDAVGNRFTPGSPEVYRTDNALLNDGSQEYSYDLNGNLESVDSGLMEYDYDSENRLVGFSDDTVAAVYTYDFMGRRVSKSVGAGTREYLYDHHHILCEYLNNSLVAHYVYSYRVDEPLMTIQNGNIYFYHADGQGNIVAITDEAGNVVQRYGYDAWGQIIFNDGNFSFDGTGLINTLTYTGREYDSESGLYHFRTRAYDPRLGRFMQRDSQQGRLLIPQTLNPYAYALNNPVSYVDPSGRMALVSYAFVLTAPSGEEVSAALAGFLHSFSTTNIQFLASFMKLIGVGYDLDLMWYLAMEETKAEMKKVMSRLGIVEDLADEAGVAGIPGAFKSGVTFEVGFKITFEFTDGERKFTKEASGGGFENGYKEALNFLGQLAPY